MLPTPGTADLVWLVTIEAGGTPIRLASRAVAVADAVTGATYVYAPGVASVSLSEEMGEPGQDAPEVSVAVTILEPTDAAVLARRGQGLALRVAEVALWVDGTDWARREVKVTGVVENPEWGRPGEPVAFTVAARLWEDRSEIPGPTERVDGTTWANASTVTAEHLGRPYPIVIGRPGVVSTTVDPSGKVEATRGVWAEHDQLYTGTAHAYGTGANGFVLIVAGHHVEVGTNGTYGGRVYTRDQDGQNEARMRIRNGYDNRGQPIAWIPWWSTYTSAPANQYDYDGNTPGWSWSQTESDAIITYGIGHSTANNSYVTAEQFAPFLTWLDDIDGGGALVWQGRALENAADVIAWACAQTGQNVDAAAFATMRTALAPYTVAAVIEGSDDGDRTRVWEWMRGSVLPMLPVSLAIGPRGVYPILWRWGAGEADAEMHLDLDLDPDIGLVSGVRLDTGSIRNRFTARYARNLRTGEYVGTMTLGPDAFNASTPTVLPSAICRLSAQLYRTPNGEPLIAEETIDLPAVYADATVTAVLESMAQRMALAVESVDVSVPLRTYGYRLRRGMVVTMTCADLGYDSRPAMVMRYEASADDDMVTVALRMLPTLDGLWSGA